MIVGNGPLDEEVNEKLASLGAPYVKCDGVPHKDVPEVLRCMDVVVMPSKQIKGWKEQFGRVAVEAMACSKVMVASDSGELPNVVQDGGLVFNEADVEDFSKCLKRVIESEELRNALGAKARKIAEEQYSWKSIATRQIEVYERLLGN
jgi:glycosyltransferase involved in cell wall biosynthesis